MEKCFHENAEVQKHHHILNEIDEIFSKNYEKCSQNNASEAKVHKSSNLRNSP